jgi:nucleotide-binding universal stress UspA family protein
MTTTTAGFRIVVATDGSSQARAAVATVLAVPWPAGTHVRAVIARQLRAPYSRSILLSALDRSAEEDAARARRTLARRWPSAEAVVVERTAVEGILHEAERSRADLVAVGWRGHGTARRLLMGSVSRGVVRVVKCAVLVVRQRPRRVRRIVIGFDASPNAQRAVQLVAKLVAPSDGRVTLVSVAEVLALRSHGPAIGGIRSTIAHEVKRINAERARAAMKALKRAAAKLRRSGWGTRTQLLTGEPLRELMAAVGTADPQLLVIGARGTSGVRQLLLGSVAEGVLNRSRVPVLLAR